MHHWRSLDSRPAAHQKYKNWLQLIRNIRRSKLSQQETKHDYTTFLAMIIYTQTYMEATTGLDGKHAVEEYDLYLLQHAIITMHHNTNYYKGKNISVEMKKKKKKEKKKPLCSKK